MTAFATAVVWNHPNKRRYGSDESYRLAAEWLRDCYDVADWGAGGCYFGLFLPATTRYSPVDGTSQRGGALVADLESYHTPSEGILIRHVLDNTPAWRTVLRNVLASFTRRLVLVTNTPDASETHIDRHDGGWPIWYFNPDDLRAEMAPHLVREVQTAAAPERVYLLERHS